MASLRNRVFAGVVKGIPTGLGCSKASGWCPSRRGHTKKAWEKRRQRSGGGSVASNRKLERQVMILPQSPQRGAGAWEVQPPELSEEELIILSHQVCALVAAALGKEEYAI